MGDNQDVEILIGVIAVLLVLIVVGLVAVRGRRGKGHSTVDTTSPEVLPGINDDASEPRTASRDVRL